jgi:hypothetical protein
MKHPALRHLPKRIHTTVVDKKKKPLLAEQEKRRLWINAHVVVIAADPTLRNAMLNRIAKELGAA